MITKDNGIAGPKAKLLSRHRADQNMIGLLGKDAVRSPVAFNAKLLFPPDPNYRDGYLIRFPDRGVEESTYWDFSSAWNVNESWQRFN